jgi:hypothetical protein
MLFGLKGRNWGCLLRIIARKVCIDLITYEEYDGEYASDPEKLEAPVHSAII